MVLRELLLVALATTCVATSAGAAVASASSSSSGGTAGGGGGGDTSSSIDFDLDAAYNTNGVAGAEAPSDYEVMPDNEERTVAGASSNADTDDLTDEQLQEQQKNRHHREVRCFCNQPHCVSQGYMCRGRGCFTDLPLLTGASHHHHHRQQQQQQRQLIMSQDGRPEHAVFSGCLEESFAERSCPPGKLCCDQDLCNHVDSPAMRLRLNRTLQVLLGEHRPYFGSMQPTGQAVQTSWLDRWLRMATIAVPICGLIMILMLATLAARLLKPLPSTNEKLNGFRMPETTPPLLGHHSNKFPLV